MIRGGHRLWTPTYLTARSGGWANAALDSSEGDVGPVVRAVKLDLANQLVRANARTRQVGANARTTDDPAPSGERDTVVVSGCTRVKYAINLRPEDDVTCPGRRRIAGRRHNNDHGRAVAPAQRFVLAEGAGGGRV